MEDEAVRRLPGAPEVAVDDHLADEGVGDVTGKVEAVAEVRQGHRFVRRRVGQEVGSQSLGLDFLRDHLLHLLGDALPRDELPDVEVEDEVRAPLPVADHQRLRRGEDVVSRILRRAREHLPREDVHVFPEVAANGAMGPRRLVMLLLRVAKDQARRTPAAAVQRRPDRAAAGAAPGDGVVEGHVRHFQEHRRRQMAALQKVQVHVHVVGRLAASFGLFLLRIFFRAVPRRLDALG
mmetsp:Transcript_2940/g.9813  ORF Transcript_2940/g.9813 Transcript_2940/m.9813 type:complete len:236 (-) Transcript_2940:2242-2949(-)